MSPSRLDAAQVGGVRQVGLAVWFNRSRYALETLNARGEPLLPADLLRNFIFLRAARQNEEQEALYKTYWAAFDEPFWRQEVVQGRLVRPRSDLFIQHFLASKQAKDIPTKHLFVEYKYWVERSAPYKTVEAELAALAKQGKDFRRLVVRSDADALGPLSSCGALRRGTRELSSGAAATCSLARLTCGREGKPRLTPKQALATVGSWPNAADSRATAERLLTLLSVGHPMRRLPDLAGSER